MGRSNSVTGPYLDKDGLDMRNGAGSLLLKKEGRFIGKLHVPNSCHLDKSLGPGHAGVFHDEVSGDDWFSYHYYDGNRDGLPWIEVNQDTEILLLNLLQFILGEKIGLGR